MIYPYLITGHFLFTSVFWWKEILYFLGTSIFHKKWIWRRLRFVSAHSSYVCGTFKSLSRNALAWHFPIAERSVCYIIWRIQSSGAHLGWPLSPSGSVLSLTAVSEQSTQPRLWRFLFFFYFCMCMVVQQRYWKLIVSPLFLFCSLGIVSQHEVWKQVIFWSM